MPPSVLITGASSGIGLATANTLAAAGWQVFAGARKLPPTPVFAPGVQFLLLDVTSAESIANARRELETHLGAGGLSALVNNAGIADLAPLEFTAPEKFRAVLEVDLFGVVAVTQAFLPLLHRGHGRIVNIGSVGGRITLPFAASLCAAKHALEAVSDALRLELWASGIAVILIQPASINSGAAEKLKTEMESTIARLPASGRQRYSSMLRNFLRFTLATETSGSPPEVVAEAVLSVLHAKNPPARRLVGKHSYLLGWVVAGLPSRVRDALIRRLLLGNPSFGSLPAGD